MKRRIVIAFMIACLYGCGNNQTDSKETVCIINETEMVQEVINITESETIAETELFVETIEETTVEQEEYEEPETPGYSEEDLYVLSHVIYGENGNGSWKQQLYTGSVVLNRVTSKRYPNTIYDVVFQRGQYACAWDGNYDKAPSERSIEAAKHLLENGSQIPYYVLYQAEFKQGDGIWLKIGDTYYCYENKDK